MPKKNSKPKPPEYPLIIETFMPPAGRLKDMAYNSVGDGPYCINGEVSLRRYRVTAELIEEPREVLIERLQKLWRECDNHHHWGPLKNAAGKLGITLSMDEVGKGRKK